MTPANGPALPSQTLLPSVAGEQPLLQETGQKRMQFIPVRKSDLVSALATEGLTDEQARDFRTLCTFLGAYYHHDFYDELTELKDNFARFNETIATPGDADCEETFTDLMSTFAGVLQRGNFVELTRDEIEHLGGEHPLLDVKTRAPMDIYDTVRIFYRGIRSETVTQKKTLSTRQVTQDFFGDVVVFVRFRKDETGRKRRSVLTGPTKLPEGIQPGSLMIKSFRNIARSELPMLLPDVRVVMSSKDALFIGGPALIGGIPIALNIIPALSVVLLVIGAYLGVSGSVSQDKLMQAVGSLSAIVGAGAFLFRQYSNYAFRKLKYQKKVSDNVYFRNVNNDTGVFDTLIGSAEEQEVKEVILAYHSLFAHGPVPHTGELDRRIEAWLQEKYGLDIDFEVGDALEKLEGLGFLGEMERKIAVCPLGEALTRLDTLWDRLYDFSAAAGSTPLRVAAGNNS